MTGGSAAALAVIMAGIAGWSGIDTVLLATTDVGLRPPLLAVQLATAHLVYDQRLIGAEPLRLASGPVFEAHTASCYVLLATSLVLLVRRWRSTTGT